MMQTKDPLPLSMEDFRSLMNYLNRFTQIRDSRFEGVLKGLLTTLEYEKPLIVQKESKVADKAFYVAEGMLFAFYYNDDNDIVPFHLFKAGEIAFIPESFMTGRAAQYNLMACGATRVLQITGSDKDGRIYTNFPEARDLALKIIASWLEKDRLRNEMLSLGNVEAVRRFYALNTDLYGNTSYRFRDMYCARYLLMSPECFSRSRKSIFPSYPERMMMVV